MWVPVVFLTYPVASKDMRVRGVRAPLVTGRERAERILVFKVADSVSHSAFLRVAERKYVTSGGNDDSVYSCWKVNFFLF